MAAGPGATTVHVLRSWDLMLTAATAGGGSAIGGQPSGEVAGALEIKQGLDARGGGIAERAVAASYWRPLASKRLAAGT